MDSEPENWINCENIMVIMLLMIIWNKHIATEIELNQRLLETVHCSKMRNCSIIDDEY